MRHSGSEGVLLDLRHLLVDQPLQPAVEQDLACVALGEIAHRRAGGILVWFGPGGPNPASRILRVEVFVERAVGGVEAQQIALSGNPLMAARREAGRRRRSGSSARRLSAATFSYSTISSARRRSDLGQRLGCFESRANCLVSRDRFDIEIEEIPVEDAVGQVGAGVVRGAVVYGVQRVERDEIGVQGGNGPID